MPADSIPFVAGVVAMFGVFMVVVAFGWIATQTLPKDK